MTGHHVRQRSSAQKNIGEMSELTLSLLDFLRLHVV